MYILLTVECTSTHRNAEEAMSMTIGVLVVTERGVTYEVLGGFAKAIQACQCPYKVLHHYSSDKHVHSSSDNVDSNQYL